MLACPKWTSGHLLVPFSKDKKISPGHLFSKRYTPDSPGAETG